MFFVESKDDVKILQDTLSSGCALYHFIFEQNRHPVDKRVSILFIYHVESDSLFILSFNHPDVVNMSIDILGYLDKTACRKLVFEKKDAMYVHDVSSYTDIKFEVYCKTNLVVDFKLPLNTHDIKSIPIMLIKKSFEDTLKLLKPHLTNFDNCTLSSDLCSAFYNIEKNGIYVNRDNYKLGAVDLIHVNNCVYSQYNYLTPTTRPSNRYGKINFAAINSKTNQKDTIVSRFGGDGILFMVDYESYHLRLFANHIEFPLPSSSLHDYFGKFYYDKQSLTGEEYEMSKKITFNLIYGGISDDVRTHIPFMAKVAEYVEKTWRKFEQTGYIETWLYKRKLYKKNYDSMNPYKLFNYLLQSAETERNTQVGMYLNNHFEKLKSKIIIYHYDAFVIDLHKSEISYTKSSMDYLTDFGNYPLRAYVGENYGNMTKLSV